jgi:hypothetical protein
MEPKFTATIRGFREGGWTYSSTSHKRSFVNPYCWRWPGARLWQRLELLLGRHGRRWRPQGRQRPVAARRRLPQAVLEVPEGAVRLQQAALV